jgi:hypothetical protein
VRGNLAFGNRAIGVYANHHPGGIDFYNNTSFDNPANYDMRPPSTGGATPHKLRNNISVGTGRAIVNLSGGASDTSNSWTLPVMATAADFASMDKALALAPRRADGSLPDNGLMRLVAGSDLIDRGENVGLPFVGGAPDLGAFEHGAVSDAGTAVVDAGTAGDAGAASDAAVPTDAGRADATVSNDAAGGGSSAPGSDAGNGTGPGLPGGGAGTADASSAAGDAGAMVGNASRDAGSLTTSEAGVVAAFDEDSGGCAIRSSRTGSAPTLLALLAVWLLRRRRARG